MLYTEIVPGEEIKITVGPKGFGMIRFLQSTDDRITQSGTQSFRTVDQIDNFVIFLPAGIDLASA